MSGKRYFVTYAPVEHVNGKMSRVSQRVSNGGGSEPSPNAFYYGYRRNISGKSCYGLREIPRNLNINPYTEPEQQNKQLFANSIAAAKIVNSTPSMAAKARNDFRHQSKYVYFFGFLVAKCRENGGVIPPSWQ